MANERQCAEGSALQQSYSAGTTTSDRQRSRMPQGAWWASPAKNTRDLATAQTPKLLYDRLDELGLERAKLSVAQGSR